ncbi:hypothetical protein LTR62_001442 [Meristemomyces frigidus]|uniref:Actin-like ATPase domain-containing protein n=1 Tax=Meristemomyces frigidus TaxID=1508187 RepID=A0AAN7TLI0_9PEZI|nr:hypothetical protein LTR62_001442 [Meristemomyces frigidus]
MAGPSTDYFTGPKRPSQPGPTVTGSSRLAAAPSSPRTPLLGRSISSQFGPNSPGSFRSEQEETIVWELGSRHLSAGFAGEAKPRCIYQYRPEKGRRVGDYRAHGERKELEGGGEKSELYKVDLRGLDLGLVEDKLGRAVRSIHADYLQLDQKSRKAVLAVPSLLPTPLLEVMLKVLFEHFPSPPTIVILTTPILACVAAGLRSGLVVEVGWEESVITAVGEYREVRQRRSVRAGKTLVKAMAESLSSFVNDSGEERMVGTKYAEEIVERMGWCQPKRVSNGDSSALIADTSTKLIPLPRPTSKSLPVPLATLAQPAESTFFPSTSTPEKPTSDHHDDNDIPLHHLTYSVLLHLPVDLRAACLERIIITGGVSKLPGVKQRLISEIHALVQTRVWDPVSHYGSAGEKRTAPRSRRKADGPVPPAEKEKEKEEPLPWILAARPPPTPNAHSSTPAGRKPDRPLLSSMSNDWNVPPTPTRTRPTSDTEARPSTPPDLTNPIPAHARLQDDYKDTRTIKAERNSSDGARVAGAGGKQGHDERIQVRGVETLGAWAGASLLATLRGVKGVHEVEREEFLRHGCVLRDGGEVF